MNSPFDRPRRAPAPTGSPDHAGLMAPRLLAGLNASPGLVMGNRAFMRAWAARRAARSLPSAPPSSDADRWHAGPGSALAVNESRRSSPRPAAETHGPETTQADSLADPSGSTS